MQSIVPDSLLRNYKTRGPTRVPRIPKVGQLKNTALWLRKTVQALCARDGNKIKGPASALFPIALGRFSKQHSPQRNLKLKNVPFMCACSLRRFALFTALPYISFSQDGVTDLSWGPHQWIRFKWNVNWSLIFKTTRLYSPLRCFQAFNYYRGGPCRQQK